LRKITPFLVLVLFCSSKREEKTEKYFSPPGKVAIRIGKDTLFVDVADTPEEREKGLMFTHHLGEKDGMLFVFEEEKIPVFWMKNTPIPLSIAFIDKNFIIVDIQQMKPMEEAPHFPPKPILYALEVRRGWFRDRGIGKGERIDILPKKK